MQCFLSEQKRHIITISRIYSIEIYTTIGIKITCQKTSRKLINCSLTSYPYFLRKAYHYA